MTDHQFEYLQEHIHTKIKYCNNRINRASNGNNDYDDSIFQSDAQDLLEYSIRLQVYKEMENQLEISKRFNKAIVTDCSPIKFDTAIVDIGNGNVKASKEGINKKLVDKLEL